MSKYAKLSMMDAVVLGAIWLLLLTALNVITQGSFRTTLLFAVPVCFVAWYHWQTGFVFAALAVICARLGGAMPEAGSTEPLWVDALMGFGKLTIDALVAFHFGRRSRAKARARASSEGAQPRH